MHAYRKDTAARLPLLAPVGATDASDCKPLARVGRFHRRTLTLAAIRTIQELLGHSHVDTMIYTRVLNRDGRAYGIFWTEGDARSRGPPILVMIGGPDLVCLSRLAGDEAVRAKSLRYSDLWGAGVRIRHEDRPPVLVSLSCSDAQFAAHVRPTRIGRSNEANSTRIG